LLLLVLQSSTTPRQRSPGWPWPWPGWPELQLWLTFNRVVLLLPSPVLPGGLFCWVVGSWWSNSNLKLSFHLLLIFNEFYTHHRIVSLTFPWPFFIRLTLLFFSKILNFFLMSIFTNLYFIS
jgi:hypothetical protein